MYAAYRLAAGICVLARVVDRSAFDAPLYIYRIMSIYIYRLEAGICVLARVVDTSAFDASINTQQRRAAAHAHRLLPLGLSFTLVSNNSRPLVIGVPQLMHTVC